VFNLSYFLDLSYFSVPTLQTGTLLRLLYCTPENQPKPLRASLLIYKDSPSESLQVKIKDLNTRYPSSFPSGPPHL